MNRNNPCWRCGTAAILVAMALGSHPGAGAAPGLRIGKGAANVIVTCPDDPKNVAVYNRRFAARELADYLARITGVTVPVVETVAADRIAAGGVIFVGPSTYTAALGISSERADLGAGGYLIKAAGGTLTILGDDGDVYKVDAVVNGDAGTYYGVAAFLEKFAGVRWLWPGDLGTVVPRRENLVIPQGEIRSQPIYLRRNYSSPVEIKLRRPDGSYSHWGGELLRPWVLFHRRHGSGISIRVGTGHYLENYVKRGDFSAHPEFFAFYDGRRQLWPESRPGQVCNGNPEVPRLFAEIIAQRCPPEGGGFSICPNDGYGFCMCDRCKAMDSGSRPWPADASGSGQIPGAVYNEKVGAAYDISNRIWTFNNRVGRLVARRAPLANLGAYAYSCYVRPPETLRHIEDNIYVIICDYWLTSSDASRFAEGWDIFSEWGRKSRRLGLYGYYFGQTCRPRHLVGVLRKFRNLGGVMHYAETSQAWANRWSEYLVGMKASWDPLLDVDALLDDYLTAGFGAGAGPMRQYLELYEQASLLASPYNRVPRAPGPAWPPPLRADLRGYLDKALQAAAGTEAEARVRFVEQGWELLDSMCGLGEAAADLKGMGLAMPGFDRADIPTREVGPAAVKARVVDARQSWDRLRAVMTAVEARKGFSVPWFSRNVYGGAFWGNAIDAWGKAVDGFYAALVEGSALPLPIEWRFRIDPGEEGKEAGWYKPEFDDAKWQSLRTDAFWERQGFGRERFPDNGTDGYNGRAWYRTRIIIPETRKEQQVLLELGAVDESFTAWLNGQQAAAPFDFHQQADQDAWQKPHVLDITRLVRWGEPNLVAVEVRDAAGAGGIWKPCFLRFAQKKTR